MERLHSYKKAWKRSFSYEKLALDSGRNDIRMLAILPCRTPKSRIRCELTVIDLDDDKTWPFVFYEALSYTWGSPDMTENIVINGLPFEIRANLASALRQLRVKGHGRQDTRYLWVDAVCINQDDIAERNLQVRKMKMIYERAEQVLAWIGAADEYSDQAIDLLHHATDFLTPDDYLARYMYFQPDETENWEKRRTIRGLARLLDRPYWRRVWVRQEIAVAKEIIVLCGDRRLTWATFVDGCDRLPMDLFEPFVAEVSAYTSSYYEICDMDSLREQVEAEGYVAFAAMLLHAKTCEATDLRDKVYGILSLAPALVTEQLQPDYSLDYKVVYREATISELQTSGSLAILSACEDPDQKSGLPTWVPDLESDWKASTLKRRMEALKGIRLYNTDANSPTRLSLSKCRNKLTLHGFHFDRIKALGGVWNGDLDTANEVVRSWQDLAMNALVPDFTTWVAFEAFWRTLTADQELEVCRVNFVSTFALHVALHIREDAKGGVPRLDLNFDFQLTEGKMSPYMEMFINTMDGRQVFTTFGGRIGIGNGELREGDLLCVLFGAQAPFALRRHDDGTYAIVNEVCRCTTYRSCRSSSADRRNP